VSVVQRRTQLRERQLEPPADGPGRRPGEGGDARRIQPFEVPEHHHGAQLLVERHHPLAEEALQLEALVRLVDRRRRAPHPLVLRLSPDAAGVVAAADVGEVAQHLGQPGARGPRGVGGRPARRQPGVLHHVLALVAGQVPGQPPHPLGLPEQLLDPDVTVGGHLLPAVLRGRMRRW
jgi:hypothetical protein